jgi:ketosteroid isomerase-like protein
MMKQLLFLLVLMTTACAHNDRANTGKDRSDIISTEAAFGKMAAEEGIATAFHTYAADSAVISRGGKLIHGREAIRDYYLENIRPGTMLQWKPDFADVSGDIGYTWGKYTLSVPDSTGGQTVTHGIFHTVWKRQPDGSWRFVWD